MTAVSNTSPLRYLIAVDRASVLGGLFRELLIPRAVQSELSAESTPQIVRNWIAHPPDWVRVVSVESKMTHDLASGLDPGEREAIQLAIERRSDVLIIDERKGRSVARFMNLPITGALGVLARAYDADLLDDPFATVMAMRSHGFHASHALIATFEQIIDSIKRAKR